MLEGQVVALTGVPPTSYNPGDIIFGDLEDLGWLIVKGVRVTEDTYVALDKVSKNGAGRGEKIIPIEDGGSNRKMKYDHLQKIKRDKDWKQIECKEFLDDIKEQILDKVFKVKDTEIPYSIGS